MRISNKGVCFNIKEDKFKKIQEEFINTVMAYNFEENINLKSFNGIKFKKMLPLAVTNYMSNQINDFIWCMLNQNSFGYDEIDDVKTNILQFIHCCEVHSKIYYNEGSDMITVKFWDLYISYLEHKVADLYEDVERERSYADSLYDDLTYEWDKQNDY